jgi:hypothetical protein
MTIEMEIDRYHDDIFQSHCDELAEEQTRLNELVDTLMFMADNKMNPRDPGFREIQLAIGKLNDGVLRIQNELNKIRRGRFSNS